ncbi:hypothetical protein Fmac_010736 [Flemingia macrophylla]|uniref:Uncharacterized protein n=1 Tax=Flemingia macrophylla TaxID=520843 RepID=A0ABD1MMK2_9FABA
MKSILYLDTNLKRFIDSHRKGHNPRTLPSPLCRASSSSFARASPTATATAQPFVQLNKKIIGLKKKKRLNKSISISSGVVVELGFNQNVKSERKSYGPNSPRIKLSKEKRGKAGYVYGSFFVHPRRNEEKATMDSAERRSCPSEK